jgi:hypothetical protein
MSVKTRVVIDVSFDVSPYSSSAAEQHRHFAKFYSRAEVLSENFLKVRCIRGWIAIAIRLGTIEIHFNVIRVAQVQRIYNAVKSDVGCPDTGVARQWWRVPGFDGGGGSSIDKFNRSSASRGVRVRKSERETSY